LVSVGNVATVIGLIIAVLGVPATLIAWRLGRSDRAKARFLTVVAYARKEQAQLSALALSSTLPAWRCDIIPMLTKPGWILPHPVPLDKLALDWTDRPLWPSAVNRDASRIFPDDGTGHRLAYSRALTELGGMSHLFDGKIYRPIQIDVDNGIRITCTQDTYFNYLDTGEALAFEAAASVLKHARSPITGKYRRSLGDPFDLSRRVASLGVITLTVRSGPNGAGFFLHHRNGKRVVAGAESIHIVPAGEFTPSDLTYEAVTNDFNLERNIIREYAEEFLDVEEAYGQGGRWIDYRRESPYREMTEAIDAGAMRISVLGIGLDPLTWKPEILTVCVIDAEAFDLIFDLKRVAASENKLLTGQEGRILVGPDGTGLPFNAATVTRYVDNPNTRFAASACLSLSWRHRVELGLG
jgi:hypothetical protein